MGKFVLIQTTYAVTGILFFVRDLMVEKAPMDKAMINAFIWPYAQFQVMKTYVLTWLSAALSALQ